MWARTNLPPSRGGRMLLDGRVLTAAFFAGSAALTVGERAIGGTGTARLVATATGAALLVASFGLRLAVAVRGPAAYRATAGRLAATHLGAVVAAALYAVSTDWGLSILGLDLPLAETGKRLRVVLECLYPAVWLASAVPLVLVQRAARPLGAGAQVEEARVSEAALAGLGLAFAAAFLFTLNYLATARDRSLDFSYFRVARPGPGVDDLVSRLEDRVEVILFFPEANEVAGKVEGYFRELAANQPHLTVSRQDRFLALDLAKKHRITSDGVVLLRKGEVGEQWVIGTELATARMKLKKLDSDFHERLTKLARTTRIAYWTTGHGEMAERAGEGLDLKGTLLRSLLKRLGFEIKNLGLSEGLGADVPEDATIVFVLAPASAFLPEEIAALGRYFDRGGRLLVALDPGRAGGLEPLLAHLGLVYGETPLASDRYFIPRHRNKSDRQIVVTASFSSHPSIAGLSKGFGRPVLVVDRSGSLDRAPSAQGLKIDFTVRSMGDTWADENGDFEYTPASGGAEGREEKRIYQLAAAVEREFAAPGEGERDARAIVLADADMLGDDLLRAVANQVMTGDSIEWLAGVEGAKTQVASEEDVPVEHTRDEDKAWFYGTVFGVPLAVLGGGLGIVRIQRRRKA